MNMKQKGKCPFCQKQVEPQILEGNTLRRDRCKCPECGEEIYLCRSPGCHDFAKGTSVYDHEFCPECTETISSTAAEIGKAALKIAISVGSAVAVAAINNKKK
jgi:hypothetical protein